jgi:uncharacterized protein Yka (UPF0111/DUF47 family)
LVRLIPRDEKFFDLFDQQSKLIARAATLLHELFMDPGRLDEWVAAIKAVEHEADDMTREVVNRLNRSFVTPLDREDILHLASRTARPGARRSSASPARARRPCT